MRSSCTALVLATALISSVAAGPVRHAHQHVHEKKDVELTAELLDAEVVPREAAPSIHYTNDWKTLTIWETVAYTYSEGQTWGEPTSAAHPDVPAETTPPAVVAAATTPPPAPPTSTPPPPPAASPTPPPSPPAQVVSNVASEVLGTGDASKILAIGFSAIGLNAQDSSAGVWIGGDGAYTNEFINAAGEGIVLTIWGSDASWVNAKRPLITHSLPAGSSVTISFATGSSGAWSGVYGDTTLVNGQVSNTWGEYTFSPEGVVDVSKEVNMQGHGMSVVGPHCTTDMTTCVFQCSDPNAKSCEFGYELLNCSPGTQPGAQSGTYGGAASGGCGWLGDSSAHLKTTFT